MNAIVTNGDVVVDGKSLTPREAILLAMQFPRGSQISRGLTLAATIAQAQRDQILFVLASAGERMARKERSKLN